MSDAAANDTPYDLDDLIYLMQRLRDPKDGCPWDLEQDYKTILPSTIEETYEVADAIERNDFEGLKEELGDFLFQAIFYAQLASEQRRFDFHEIIDGLVTKLIRRHPHVFPMGTLASRKSDVTEEQSDVKKRWEELKEEERRSKGLADVFDDVPHAFPALLRAQKLQKRAARQGFDWRSHEPVFDKILEELDEVKNAISEHRQVAIEEEVGDLLFSCVNLARHLKVDAETAMRRAGKKFEDRFQAMQALHAISGSEESFETLATEQLEKLWEEVKKTSHPRK